MEYKGQVCRGAYALGTACGMCEKCLEQKEQYQAAKSVREMLDGTASLKATIARLTAELTAAVAHAKAMLAPSMRGDV